MLHDYLDAALRYGAGRTDAIPIAAAHAADDPAPLADLATALAPSRERRAEAAAQGAAFAVAIRAVEGWDLPDMPLPVAVGRAARPGRLPVLPVAQVAALAWVTHLAQAAQRLMPLGQTAAQRVVAALAPTCAQVAAEGVALTPDDIGGCAFALGIASMRHEGQEPRLFRS